MILGSVGAVVTLWVVAELFMRVGPSGFVLPKTAPPADAAAPLLPGPAAAPSAAAPGTAEDQAANAEPAVPAMGVGAAAGGG